jgi:hypothetical protein
VRESWRGRHLKSTPWQVAAVHMLGPQPLEILSLGEGQGRNVVHLAALGHTCTGVPRKAPHESTRFAGVYEMRLSPRLQGWTGRKWAS